MDIPPYTPDRREAPHWEIERKIPVAMLLAILGNAFVTGWWAANTSARLTVVESAITTSAKMPEAVARLDEKMNALREDVGLVKEDIRRLGIRGRQP